MSQETEGAVLDRPSRVEKMQCAVKAIIVMLFIPILISVHSFVECRHSLPDSFSICEDFVLVFIWLATCVVFSLCVINFPNE